MSYQYTRLKSIDLESLRSLNQLFGHAFDQSDSYGDHPPADEYLRRFLANPNHIVLVAKDRDAVIGGLVAYVLPKFEQARSEIYIYDLAVTSEYRRQKVATQLIQTLRTIAKDLGAYVIFVQADYDDDPAIKLYQSLGSQEEVLHFDINP